MNRHGLFLSGLAIPLFAACPVANAASAPAVPPLPLTSMEKNIETLGTATAIALPLIAGGISLYKHDRIGLAELAAETVLTVGTAYALKQFVREKRPDGSDFHSFPSETTALAASGSSYLWGRYGWQYGLPALVATEFVSYSRVQAKQHHWYDTLASSAIAAAMAMSSPRRSGRSTSIPAWMRHRTARWFGLRIIGEAWVRRFCRAAPYADASAACHSFIRAQRA